MSMRYLPVYFAMAPDVRRSNATNQTCLSGSRYQRENVATAVPKLVLIGKEEIGQIQRGRRSIGEKPRAALAGDVGEALGHIGAAGEDDRLDPGADRALRRA